MKRKIGVLLSALLFVGAFGAPSAFGAQEIPVTVDGELLQTDTPAQLIDGNTMVPLRAICDALGAEVDWNASEKKITISEQKKKPSNNAKIALAAALGRKLAPRCGL